MMAHRFRILQVAAAHGRIATDQVFAGSRWLGRGRRDRRRRRAWRTRRRRRRRRQRTRWGRRRWQRRRRRAASESRAFRAGGAHRIPRADDHVAVPASHGIGPAVEEARVALGLRRSDTSGSSHTPGSAVDAVAPRMAVVATDVAVGRHPADQIGARRGRRRRWRRAASESRAFRAGGAHRIPRADDHVAVPASHGIGPAVEEARVALGLRRSDTSGSSHTPGSAVDAVAPRMAVVATDVAVGRHPADQIGARRGRRRRWRRRRFRSRWWVPFVPRMLVLQHAHSFVRASMSETERGEGVEGMEEGRAVLLVQSAACLRRTTHGLPSRHIWNKRGCGGSGSPLGI